MVPRHRQARHSAPKSQVRPVCAPLHVGCDQYLQSATVNTVSKASSGDKLLDTLLFDTNIVGIFVWDFDGRMLHANDAFLRIVGYEREDLVAGRMRWSDLTPPELLERQAERLRQHQAAGRLQPFEKEYFRKDGTPRARAGRRFEVRGTAEPGRRVRARPE